MSNFHKRQDKIFNFVVHDVRNGFSEKNIYSKLSILDNENIETHRIS